MRTYEFEIPVNRFGYFEKQAKRLAKKADKLDVPFDFEVGDTVTRSIPHRKERKDGSVKTVKVPVDFQKVTIIGDEGFSINGWQLIAKVKFEEGGTIISSQRNHLSEEFGDTDNSCDHCGYDRRRKTVLLIENEKTGEKMQVGSTCLNDFLGHPSALDVAQFYSDLKDLSEDSQKPESGYWSVGSDSVVNVETYLNYVDEVIKECGWLSRSKAYGTGRPATADVAMNVYYSGHLPSGKSVAKGVSDEVKAALEWAANLDADNDYLHNIKVIANSEYIEKSHTGYAASILPAYRRHLATKKKKDAGKASEWVGKKGERVETEVILEDVKEFPDSWNPGEIRHMYKMVDADRNIIVWWTGSNKLADKKGEKLSVRATVKKHDDYKGTKQTLVNRVYVK